MNKDKCFVDLSEQFGKITRIIKKALTQDAKAEFKGDRDALNKYVDEELAGIEEDLKTVLEKGFRDEIDEVTLSVVKGSAKRRLTDLITTYQKTNNILFDLEAQLKGADDANTVMGAVKTIYQNYNKNITAEALKTRRLFEQQLTGMVVRGKAVDPVVGKQAEEALKDAIFMGRTSSLDDYVKANAKDANGLPIKNAQDEIYRAVWNGHHKDPVLDLIQGVLNSFKSENLARVQKLAPYLDLKQGHVKPLKYSRDKLKSIGKEEFKKDVTERANLDKILGQQSEGKLDKLVDDLWDFYSYDSNVAGVKKPQGIYSRRLLEYKGLSLIHI